MTPRSNRVVSIRAPAKINLSLEVLNRNPDGYHNIYSLMQTIGLYDRLEVQKVARRAGIGLTISGLSVARRDNLVLQAARLFLKKYKIRGGVQIHLHKEIPISAGLGGGSSDAAATLVALSRLWDIRPSFSELTSMARSIGSDLPFFLSGPAALVQGTGEKVQSARPVGKAWAVLVKKDIKVSTAWAYRQWDRIQRKRRRSRRRDYKKIWLTSPKKQNNINPKLRLTFRPKKLSPYLHNDLEEVTGAAFPVIGKMKKQLRELGASGVLMSGSGPTVFGIFHKETLGKRAARALIRQNKDWKVWVVKLLERSSFTIRRSSNG